MTDPLTTALLLAWLNVCCIEFKVSPPFARAVSTIETGAPVGQIKTGSIDSKGRFWAPMGIARCFGKDYDIASPYVNIWLGVRALRGTGTDEARQKRRLRKYNAKFTMAYWREIKKVERVYRRVQ